MYTTTKATREQALKAAAAARRAMKRHTCCKSQFKFKCFSCGEMINRGDKITRCMGGSTTGMELRYRGGDNQNGLTMAETAFYLAETGKDKWVHIGCYPCYWDKGYDNGDESSPPALCAIQTEWGCKVYREFDDWTSGPGGESWLNMGVPYFLMVKGYPKEKFMRARISHAVARFQALWRGYLYKKAYPVALLQAQADQMYPHEMQQAVYETIDSTFAYLNQKWLGNGEGGGNDATTGADNVRVQEATAHEQRARARYALYQEMLRTSPDLGDHVEILFNANEPSEHIYSGEVIEVQYRGDWVKIKVKFHYDGEVRKYTGKKFKLLKKECEEHKKKLGIEAKLTGRLNTARIGRIVFPNSSSIQDWRYHYPDGTHVQ